MKVQIYYLSGNIGSIDTTLLSYQDGMLVDDSYLDASDLENKGLLLTRGTYEATKEGRLLLGDPIAIIRPDEISEVGLVTVDGAVFLKRVGDRFVRAMVEQLTALGVMDLEEDAGIEIQDDEASDFEDVVI